MRENGARERHERSRKQGGADLETADGRRVQADKAEG